MDVDSPRIRMYGIRTPLITPGDDMGQVIADTLDKESILPEDGDILILAESAVATAEGRMVKLSCVTPGPRALELAEKYCLDPREMELVLQECDEVIGGVPGAALTITRGNLAPNAGIDGSNAPEGHVVLLPADPMESARRIRKQLEGHFSCHIGVIVGDSRTQPLRLGCVGVALGTSGLLPVEDARGSCDLFGKPLHITRKAVADNLVSAAQLVMGEANERIPCVLVRGSGVTMVEGSEDMPLFTPAECMYYSDIDHSRS